MLYLNNSISRKTSETLYYRSAKKGHRIYKITRLNYFSRKKDHVIEIIVRNILKRCVRTTYIRHKICSLKTLVCVYYKISLLDKKIYICLIKSPYDVLKCMVITIKRIICLITVVFA